MKQLTSSKDCLNCKDPCCEFSWVYRKFSPVITEEEREKLLKQGISEKNFKKRGKSWQIRLKFKRLKHVCPFIKLFDGKRICGIQKNKPLDCKMFPFTLVKQKGKLFLGICRKDSSCHVSEKLIKTKKFQNHVKYLKSYLRKNKLKIKNNPDLIFPHMKEVEIICEI